MGTRLNRLAEAVLTSTHNLFFEQKYEKISEFLSENFFNFFFFFFFFLVVKFSVYLNRRVFVTEIDQPALSHRLFRIFSILDSQGCKVSSHGQRRLIRPHKCAD